MKETARTSLLAGSATRDITPTKPTFLVGYPHVPRMSTGVHDPLLASALYLADGKTALLLIGLDILFISQRSTTLCREAISRATGIPAGNVLISASHTHSGPVTNDQLAWSGDPLVPPADPAYMEQFHRGIIEAGVAAHAAAEPARFAVTSAVADGVGCNRLDPKGPFDSEVGLLAIKSERDGRLFALDLVYGMHPTVLHEDSHLVSSDFPHFTRQQIVAAFPSVTTVYHNAPSGNLSPRYHVKGQTFAEAERLGRRLGASVVRSLRALKDTEFRADILLGARQGRAGLMPNKFPSVAEAETKLRQARERYEQLKRDGVPHGLVRTAECVVFGAEMALALARAQASGEVARRQADFGRAEVQVFQMGELFLAALPGEQFVEYGLEIKRRAPGRAFVICNANGELQGYIVTPEAAAAGGYEAAWSLFRAESGARMVSTAVELMKELQP
jgi:hypothetical protein